MGSFSEDHPVIRGALPAYEGERSKSVFRRGAARYGEIVERAEDRRSLAAPKSPRLWGKAE
jgi:hypothetical protein